MRDAKCEMQNVKGFSLIELVFAMSFLTFIIFGVVSLQSSNLAMMGRQNNQIQANLYANQGLQIIKGLGYDSNLYNNCKTSVCEKKIDCISTPKTCELVNSSGQGDYEEIKGTVLERIVEIDSRGFTNAYLVTTYIEWEDATGEHRRADNAHVEAKRIIY